MRRGLPLAALVLIPLLSSCEGGRSGESGRASKADLEAAASMRVFFGHQSVGRNILEGTEALEREAGGLGPRIVESRDPNALSSPAIAHAPIGRNGDPIGKIRDFIAIVEGGMGERVDLALMKFCYVDVTAGSDVEALFAEYSRALSRLAAEYPRASFPMATLPLTTVEGGLKALAKRILGRPLFGQEDDIAREKFNELVRRTHPNGAGFFDLARIESTPDGTGKRGGSASRSFRALRSEYSSDGGHLSELGARVVASNFLSFLAAEGARSGSPD